MLRSRFFRTAVVPFGTTNLIGTSGDRNHEQQRIYKMLKETSLLKAFPHLAACWVGPCWGSVMLTPAHVSPVCNKLAVWRCSVCLKEFEMHISKFINEGGICPLCNSPQKVLEAPLAQREEGASHTGVAQYSAAPRMIHSNYRSVLHTNPEWEHMNIQPMLAQRWELIADELLHKIEKGEDELLLASPKVDGIRCMIGYNTKRKEVQFFSRGGILFECCHGLVPHVAPLFEQDPTLMLDGELFAPECSFEQLNGLARRRAKRCSATVHSMQHRLLEYFAFDIMYSARLSRPDAPFSERYKFLKTLIPVCGAKRISNYQHDEKKKKLIRSNNLAARTDDAACTTKLYHVPAAQVHADEMDDVLTEACSQGFEGVMIRRPHFPYEHGKRSFGLLKYKQMHDAEFRIVDVLPGEGKFKGGIGAFVCETKDGFRFNAPPSVTIARRKQIWDHREKYLGLYVTVQYQELSSQDVPRFPIAKSIRGGANRSEWL